MVDCVMLAYIGNPAQPLVWVWYWLESEPCGHAFPTLIILQSQPGWHFSASTSQT